MDYINSRRILLGNPDVFTELVKTGVIDLTVKNTNDQTLLHDCTSQFKLLIELGIDVDAQDTDGHTWLHGLYSVKVQEYFGYLLNSVDISTETDSSAKKDTSTETDKSAKKFNPNIRNKAGNSLLMCWDNVDCIRDLLILDEKYFSEPLRYLDLFENRRFEFQARDVKELLERYANEPSSKTDVFDISQLLLNKNILKNPEALKEVLKYDPDPITVNIDGNIPMDLIYAHQLIQSAGIMQEYCRTYAMSRGVLNEVKYYIFSTCIVSVEMFNTNEVVKKLRKDGDTFDKVAALVAS